VTAVTFECAKLNGYGIAIGVILLGMAKHLQSTDNKHPTILSAEKDGEDGILVSFSDGTVTGYVVEELLRLRPVREKVEVPVEKVEGPVLVPTKKRM
jgi:hypothetical protein